MDLTQDAINRIVELSAPTMELIEGRTYASKPLTGIAPPVPASVAVKGLDALVGFLLWEFPGGRGDLIASVVDHRNVAVAGRLIEPWKQRPTLAAATFEEGTRFKFGEYMSQEAFLIGVQVGFVPDETTAKLLRLVGTVQDSKVLNLKDDGVTQQVSASVGLAQLGLVDVPNPVLLRPYRTFPEVEQPRSMYIVRARSGQGEAPPSFALFEVEDPLWRAVARASIAAYLREKVSDLTVLA
jgi:hypothetical protein